MMHHNVVLGDVVQLECFEDEEMEEDNHSDVSPVMVVYLYVTVTDSDGNNNPYTHFAGMSCCTFSIPLFLFDAYYGSYITKFCI